MVAGPGRGKRAGVALAEPEREAVLSELRWQAASRSFLWFLRASRLKVRPPKDQVRLAMMTGGLEAARKLRYQLFKPWPHQVELAPVLERGDSVVVLKARQLGISWLLVGYVLWVMIFRPGSLVLLISMDQRTSNELFGKLMTLWRSVETYPWLRDHGVRQKRLVQPATGASEMELSNDSKVMSLPSTEDAGRSFTADVVLVDEAAFHKFADANFDAYEPTLDGGGQLIVCSTANGVHGLFAELWRDAVAKVSDLVPVFIPWWARPDRQEPVLDEGGEPVLDERGHVVMGPSQRWLERTRGRRHRAAAKLRQEYPATPGEAFVAASGLVYGMAEDGVLVFSPAPHNEFTPEAGGNLSPDPIAWRDCRMHFGYVDWGGGDPTALGVIGVLSSGRIHQFAEKHWEGGTVPTLEMIGEFFAEWAPRPANEVTHGYDGILCGKESANSIATLAAMGYPAKAADTDREEGFDTMTDYLRKRQFTLNPETCPMAVVEFDAYYWMDKKDPRSGERRLTRTPSWTHADHKDGERYVLMEVHKVTMKEGGSGDGGQVVAKLGRRQKRV